MVSVDENLNKQLTDINSLKGNVSDICNRISRDVGNALISLVQEGAIFEIKAGTAGRLQDAYNGIGTNTGGGRTPTSLRENLETALSDKVTLHGTLTAALTTGRTTNPAIAQELTKVNSEITSIRAAIGTTANLYNIYSNLSWIAEHFNTGGLSNVANTVQYNTGGMNFQTHTGTLDLDTDFNGTTTTTLTTPPGLTDKGYSLCDENGKVLTKITTGTTTTYKITIEGTEYTLGGIADPITNPLNLSAVTITPQPKTFPNPLNLKLSIKKTYEATVNGKTMNFVHKKPLNLSITEAAATLPVLSTVYPRFSTTTVTLRRRTGNDLLNETYLHNKELWEKSAYQKFFSEGPKKAKYDALSPEQKQILMERVKAWQAEVFTTRNQIFASDTDMQSIFEQYVTKNENIPEENRKTENDYKNYLITNYSSLLEKSCKEYYAEVLSKGPLITPILTPTSPHGHSYRDELDQIFATFLQDLENGKFDTTSQITAIEQLDGRRGEANEIHDYKLGVFNRGRINYSRILKGNEANMTDQDFVYSEGGVDKKVTFSMRINSEDRNRFSVHIPLLIDGKKNELNFTGSSPDKLMKSILECPFTPDRTPLNGKLRCRMVLSFLKGLITMCPNSKVASGVNNRLERELDGFERFGGRNFSRLACEVDKAGNLKLVASNPITTVTRGGRTVRSFTMDSYTVFDEAAFMQIPDENLLQYGIGRVAGEVTRILNAQAKNVKDEIDDGIVKKSNYGKSFKTPCWWRKLWNLGANGKDLEHSFETHTSGDVEIAFDGKKGIFTLRKGDGEVSHKDLGKILQNPLFDGQQFEIMSKVNQAYRDVLFAKSSNNMHDTYFAISDNGSYKNTRKIYVVHGTELFRIDPLLYPGTPSIGNADVVDLTSFPTGLVPCNDLEKEAFYSDPVLSGRFLKLLKKKMKYGKKGRIVQFPGSSYSYRQAA